MPRSPHLTTFDQVRREAYRLLGDAADVLRYPDVPETTEQRKARRAALRLIGEAKDTLNEVAGVE